MELTIEPIASKIRQYASGGSFSGTGFYNINCPLCVRRGQRRADQRHRCGIKFEAQQVGLNCFNCGAKATYRLGRPFSGTFREFLSALGVPEREVKLLAFWADGLTRTMAAPEANQQIDLHTGFRRVDLPSNARSLQEWAEAACDHPDYLAVVAYLLSRGDEILNASTYYWSPSTSNQLNRRLIIPCEHDRSIVGWMARSIDPDITPKYYKQTPTGLLFNSKCLNMPNRPFLFIVEGAFDALAIQGVAALRADLNDAQIAWINNSGKTPIVVPDRDKTGQRLVELAIRQNWYVATPHYGAHQWWDANIKDPADAVVRYGGLFVVRSILATATDHPGVIRQRTNYFYKEK